MLVPLLSGLVELLGSWRLGERLRLLSILPTFTIGHNSPWGRDEWVLISQMSAVGFSSLTQLSMPGRVCFPESPCWKVRVLTPIVQMMKLRLRDYANGRGKQVRSRRNSSPSGSDSWAGAVALLPSVWWRRNMLKLRDGPRGWGETAVGWRRLGEAWFRCETLLGA